MYMCIYLYSKHSLYIFAEEEQAGVERNVRNINLLVNPFPLGQSGA